MDAQAILEAISIIQHCGTIGRMEYCLCSLETALALDIEPPAYQPQNNLSYS